MIRRPERVNYMPLIVAGGGLFLFGFILILLSHFITPTPRPPFPWPDAIRDIGMVIAPIAVVSILYEVNVRQQFERHMHELANGFSSVTLVFPESRPAAMEDIISSAKDSLIIVGITPLFEFSTRVEWLAQKFSHLKSVKIFCLSSTSKYAETRAEQSTGKSDINAEVVIHDRIISSLQRHIQGSNVTIMRYDLPPAEFFYIADRKVLLATWYPYGRGESSPCIYVDNGDKGDSSRKLLKYFLSAYETLASAVNKTSLFDQKKAPSGPPSNSSSADIEKDSWGI